MEFHRSNRIKNVMEFRKKPGVQEFHRSNRAEKVTEKEEKMPCSGRS